MFFLQAAQAPLPVVWKDRVLYVPRLSMDLLVEWASEIQARNTAAATEGLDEVRRREYLSFYPPASPDFPELRREVQTPEGAKAVLRKLIPNSEVRKLNVKTLQGEAGLPGLTPEEVDEVLAWNPGTLSKLAWELAELNDRSSVLPPELAKAQRDQLAAEGGADPLKSGGKPVSKL